MDTDGREEAVLTEEMVGWARSMLKRMLLPHYHYLGWEAEDIIQDCLLTLVKRWHTYDGHTVVWQSYMTLVLKHALWWALHTYYKQHRIPAYGTDHYTLATFGTPWKPDDVDLESLIPDPTDREIALLRASGMSTMEISSETGVDRLEVLRRLRRMKKEMRQTTVHPIDARASESHQDGINASGHIRPHGKAHTSSWGD